MAAFRLYDKTQTWFGMTCQPLPGGYFKFYEAGTLTPANVYGNRDLSTNNGSQVDLDASSRLEHECWADTADAFFVEIYDADDVKQAEVSYFETPGGAGQVIPIPSAGEYLTGDGVQFLVEDLTDNLLPDQTGHSNEILGTDGSVAAWVARPADGASDVEAAAGTFTANDGTDTFQILSGTDSAPASGTVGTTKSITFSTAFGATPVVHVLPTSSSNPGGPTVPELTSVSTSGFTVRFDVAEGNASNSNITNAVPFNWSAIGLKA